MDISRRNRLSWFGHIHRMDDENWVKKVTDLEVAGRRIIGRPRKTWKEVVKCDLQQNRTRGLALDCNACRAAIT